jgi:hypothetical protein
MKSMRPVMARTALLLCVFLFGCAGQPADRLAELLHGKGAPALSEGIRAFEEGRYAESARSLNAALERGLSASADLARAHKYLAFIHCVSNRIAPCRQEFVRALEAQPGMELEPSEAGHPTWGPVFRSVRTPR